MEGWEPTYRLLDRCKQDCEYYLGYGNRCEKHLWAGNVRDHIQKMRELYDMLPEKPEWLTAEQIDEYAERMGYGMENKLTIKFGDYEIVAEIDNRNGPAIPPEMIIYIRDKNGSIVQDVCLVRPHYEFVERKRDFEVNNDYVDCIVWADSYDDDYTDKLMIEVYKGGE